MIVSVALFVIRPTVGLMASITADGIGGATLRRLLPISLFVPQKLGTFVASENAADLRVLTGLVDSGAVTPAIDRTFPLAEAAQAYRVADAGAGGKVCLVFNG